jgi:hypothetical protein
MMENETNIPLNKKKEGNQKDNSLCLSDINIT